VRWVTVETGGDERVGVVEDDTVHLLAPGAALLDLLPGGAGSLAEARERAVAGSESVPLDAVRLRPPVPLPPSVRDFLAFEEHLRNSRMARQRDIEEVWYEQPVFYFSNPAAICGPRDDVAVPPGCTQFDYELEIAAVVGPGGADLTPEEAEACIAGYTILCDWSARDLQVREMQIGLGPVKGKDSATSLGPWLVTPDELGDRRFRRGYDLTMTAEVNGRRYTAGNFETIYWSFPEMLAYASQGTRLRPGDVVGSGTVGRGCILELSGLEGHERYPWLAPGDEVRLEVERLGSLTHRVVEGRPPAWDPAGRKQRTQEAPR
jgi:2-keto-4-pentenoate hydratase/2-oxohepta-3-ene-1,7-dioic acid hydratase in catechol pathway